MFPQAAAPSRSRSFPRLSLRRSVPAPRSNKFEEAARSNATKPAEIARGEERLGGGLSEPEMYLPQIPTVRPLLLSLSALATMGGGVKNETGAPNHWPSGLKVTLAAWLLEILEFRVGVLRWVGSAAGGQPEDCSLHAPEGLSQGKNLPC